LTLPLASNTAYCATAHTRDGDPAPLPKRGRSPQFSAHLYRGQTAGWIKMVLGMEVGLSPGDFVLDGNPAPPQKGTAPPIFGPCLLRPNGCMHQDASWYGGKRRPGRHCVMGTQLPCTIRGGARSPIFAPFLLWQNDWMHQNATSYGLRPQPRGLCVRCRPTHPLQKGGGVPPISAHVYCGQTAGCMKTPLGTEVDLGPGHIILDGVPAVR